MKVRDLIKELKKMPQNLEVGYVLHDYDIGDSESINSVTHLNGDEVANESGVADHTIVLGS